MAWTDIRNDEGHDIQQSVNELCTLEGWTVPINWLGDDFLL